MTGAVSLDTELLPKRLQLLHELIPAATVIAALLNPANAARYENLTSELNAAAAAMGLQIKILRARADSDFDGVFATLLNCAPPDS